MKFSVEGSDRVLAIDVPLSKQGVNDYSVIEVTDLPKSESPSDRQTLSESSTITSFIDDTFNYAIQNSE